LRIKDKRKATSDAGLLESVVIFRETHTIFGRAEIVEKEELFPPGDPREHERSRSQSFLSATFTIFQSSTESSSAFAAWAGFSSASRLEST
jgi:hypothetical protein